MRLKQQASIHKAYWGGGGWRLQKLHPVCKPADKNGVQLSLQCGTSSGQENSGMGPGLELPGVAMTLAGALEVFSTEGQSLGRDPESLIGILVWKWVAYQVKSVWCIR